MPPSKDQMARSYHNRPTLNTGPVLTARVYQPATNLLPPSPPNSPTAVAAGFSLQSSRNSSSSISRQNSHSGNKYS
ncbi:hypothetical protein EVAR_59989_1 [Eumeta japonica]|uniref:Uncharacterized protein n=1 Tax=Eumeta variegata TaxID=151549 RepID=A0A4C1ZLS9_EUMVA|nr:hypothetical protein EVAR_59989_1 [Eumeta japonica]